MGVWKVATPSLSVGSGTYATFISVTLSTATTDAVLRYTLDGSDPTSTSPQYAAPITIDSTTTLKAGGFKSNWSDSNVTSGVYAMQFGTLAAPNVDPPTDNYVPGVTVTMSSMPAGTTVRYTTAGATPTASSAVYTSPLSVSATTTVKAKAFHPDYAASPDTSRTGRSVWGSAAGHDVGGAGRDDSLHDRWDRSHRDIKFLYESGALAVSDGRREGTRLPHGLDDESRFG